jgi:heme exporter protein C
MSGEKIKTFLLENAKFELSLLLLVGVAIFYSLYLVFMVVPNEQVMGAVQRIFYFHVGAAMACYVLIAVLFMSSVLYLVSKSVVWDQVSIAAGEVACLFCSIVLFSGMIWGHSAWNTWWRWEPRLVSFLVLWLLLLAYALTRSFLESDEKLQSFSSVVGILVAIQIPIVIFSVRLLSPQEQLHPEVVANQGLKDSRFVLALISANISTILLGLLLFLYRVRQEFLKFNLLRRRLIN